APRLTARIEWPDHGTTRAVVPDMRTPLLFVALAACAPLGDRAITGKCPAGEVCSPDTPDGLQFVGPGVYGDLFLTGPGTTVVGGTQAVTIMENSPGDIQRPFTLPYTADGGAAVGIAGQSGSTVTLAGLASGTNELRIVDPGGDL